MGFFIGLLAIVSAISLVALVQAVTGRIKNAGFRWLLRVVGLLLIIGPLVIVASVGIYWTVRLDFPLAPILNAGAFASVAIAGILLVLFQCLRRRTEENTTPRHCHWPIGKLFLLSAISVGIMATLFVVQDRRITRLQAEADKTARQIALSLKLNIAAPEDNAATTYENAFAEIDTQHANWDNDVDRFFDGLRNGTTNPTDPTLIAFLDKSRKARELFRIAGQQPSCDFGIDYLNESSAGRLSPFHSMRYACRFLCLSALFNARNGDYDEAIDDLNASFAMAIHISDDAYIIATLVSDAMFCLTYETLEEIIRDTDIDTSHLCQLELNESFSFLTAIARSAQMDFAFGTKHFVDPPKELGFPIGSNPDLWEQLLLRIGVEEYRLFNWETDWKIFNRAHKKWSELLAEPYFQVADEGMEFDNARPQEGLISAFVVPEFTRLSQVNNRAEAKRLLVILAQRLWQYKADDGDYPESLETLIPKYIEAIPIDPFSGQTVKMVNDGEHIVIYSIGIDGVDNHGQAWDYQKQTGDDILTIDIKK